MILLVPIIFTLAFFALVVWLVPKLDPPAVRVARRRGADIPMLTGRMTAEEAWRDLVTREAGSLRGIFARAVKRRHDIVEPGRRRND